MQANYVFQSWTVDMKFNWVWLIDSVRMSSMSKWPTPQHLNTFQFWLQKTLCATCTDNVGLCKSGIWSLLEHKCDNLKVFYWTIDRGT